MYRNKLSVISDGEFTLPEKQGLPDGESEEVGIDVEKTSDTKEANTDGSPGVNVFVTSWKRWANDSTLHGIKVITDDTENKIKRIVRMACMLVFLGFLGYLIYDQTTRYLQYNTVTMETTLFEDEMEFPSVTICNHDIIHTSNALSYRDSLVLNYVLSWPKPDSQLSYFHGNHSLRNMLQDKFITPGDLFTSCYFGRTAFNCDAKFVKKQTSAGTCFTFNAYTSGGQGVVTSTVGSDFNLVLKGTVNQNAFRLSQHDCAAFKVVVHPRGERPDMTKAVTLSPGFVHYVAIEKRESTFLPHPVKAFDTKECVDTTASDFVSPLRYYTPYSTTSCFDECLLMHVNRTCNCIGPFFAPDKANEFQECHINVYVTCHDDAVANFTSSRLINQCNCPIPCNTVRYETKLSSGLFPSQKSPTVFGYSDAAVESIRNNMLHVRIYFDSLLVKVNKQVLEYEFADLLGSMGGYLGLAVGASLLTLIEILEQVIVSCCEFYETRRKVKPIYKT